MSLFNKAKAPSQDIHRIASSLIDLIKLVEGQPDAPDKAMTLRKCRDSLKAYRDNHEPKWGKP